MLDYREAGKPYGRGEGKGVALVDAHVAALRKLGLLRERSPQAGASEAIMLPKETRVFDIAIPAENMNELEQVESTGALHVGTWARDIIRLAAKASSEEPQILTLAALGTRTMGLRADYPITTKQVWERAKKFGKSVTVKEMIQVAIEAAKGNVQVETGKPLVGIMDPITGSSGDPSVLDVERRRDGLWFCARFADPGDRWGPDDQFVVSPGKVISS
jgi:hypothetical protein